MLISSRCSNASSVDPAPGSRTPVFCNARCKLPKPARLLPTVPYSSHRHTLAGSDSSPRAHALFQNCSAVWSAA
ncbi:hypothetical protein [Nonomuraea sp. NPDC050202]|uniref:hypothetical protein n=1 Tax=Nonomuraea sp. NPDC050202 TaxID=3155035 RepID=UPI0033CF6AB3